MLQVESFSCYYCCAFQCLPYLEVVVLLPALDPALALALGVNQQREAGGFSCDDAVLNREVVRGQALNIPLANLADTMYRKSH